MTQFLFFKGHDVTPQGAIARALVECAPVLMDNPSLLIQLESINPMGHEFDADIRVMAVDTSSEEGVKKKHRSKDDPAERDDIDNPDTAKHIDPDAWRTLRQDGPPAAFRFGNAAKGGEVPDVPLQDIEIRDYEMARASEPELKRIMQELEKKRLENIEQAKLELE